MYADAIHADGVNLRSRHVITDAMSTRLLNGIYKGNSLGGYVINFSDKLLPRSYERNGL
jgi:hypothetical protein